MSDQATGPEARERLSGDVTGARAGFGAAVRGNMPVLVTVGLVAVSALGYMLLAGGTSEPPPPSRAPQAPLMEATQRGNELSPEFRRQIQEADAARAQEALRLGGSALPTPVFEPTPRPPARTEQPAPEPTPVASEPPAALPPPLPMRPPELPPPVPVTPSPAAARPIPSPQEVNAVLQAMQRQAEALLNARLQAATTQFFETGLETGGAQSEAAPQIPATSIRAEGTEGSAAQVVPPPGTILYARLLGRANSDTPGPVIAEILQGELIGARVIGQFQAGRDGLLIQFRTLTIPARSGRPASVHTIEAVAVDTEHLGTSLATSINRRELERVALAFGTAFMRGLGQAVAQSGAVISQGLTGTVIQNPVLDTRRQLLVGAGAAAGAAGEVIQDIYGNRPPTIIVEAGTPFGLLFLGGR